jgi:hypothetical protein
MFVLGRHKTRNTNETLHWKCVIRNWFQNVKVKLSLAHAINAYGKVHVHIHLVLTSAVDPGERSASSSAALRPGKERRYPVDRTLV